MQIRTSRPHILRASSNSFALVPFRYESFYFIMQVLSSKNFQAEYFLWLLGIWGNGFFTTDAFAYGWVDRKVWKKGAICKISLKKFFDFRCTDMDVMFHNSFCSRVKPVPHFWKRNSVLKTNTVISRVCTWLAVLKGSSRQKILFFLDPRIWQGGGGFSHPVRIGIVYRW